jgi:hypothetical protein
MVFDGKRKDMPLLPNVLLKRKARFFEEQNYALPPWRHREFLSNYTDSIGIRQLVSLLTSLFGKKELMTPSALVADATLLRLQLSSFLWSNTCMVDQIRKQKIIVVELTSALGRTVGSERRTVKLNQLT